MRRSCDFYVSDEEKSYLERYLTVIRECSEDKVMAVTFTVDTYFKHLQNKSPGYSKQREEVELYRTQIQAALSRAVFYALPFS